MNADGQERMHEQGQLFKELGRLAAQHLGDLFDRAEAEYLNRRLGDYPWRVPIYVDPSLDTGFELRSSVAPNLCPQCGAYWRCDCPPPLDVWFDQSRDMDDRFDALRYAVAHGNLGRFKSDAPDKS